MHACTQTDMHAQTKHTYLSTWHTHMHTNVHVCTHTCMSCTDTTYIPCYLAYTHAHKCTCMHTYTHGMRIHTHTYLATRRAPSGGGSAFGAPPTTMYASPVCMYVYTYVCFGICGFFGVGLGARVHACKHARIYK